MLYVSRRDGSTRSYDLRSVDGRKAFIADRRATDPADVRSVALAENGARADLPMPRRFRIVAYEAALETDRRGVAVAEVVRAVCDGLVVSLTMYLNGRSNRFRLDVGRPGT